MPEALITNVDAAGTTIVDGSLAPRLAGFVCDLTRLAAGGSESAARRALCSPFSGVPNVDARALCAVAGTRHGVVETIERERVPLERQSALAAHAFVRALGELRRAYRAQGATAREHVTTIALAFDLPPAFDAPEARTFAVIEEMAARLDEMRPPGEDWEGDDLTRAIEALDFSTPLGPIEIQADPLPQREPETPSLVKRRRGHFSASSLGTFAECERRWYYRYVCAAVEDRGSSASYYGTAFHWALERFHQEFPRADGVAPQELEAKLDAYLATAFERFRAGFETNVEFELQRRRAKRTGRRYLAWFLERARAQPFTVIGTETTVELDLDGHTFVGYIDRLDRDDATGAVTVVDYKTGSIAESAAEYREEVARFVDFQLPFYYWARTAAGDRVTRLALVPLKDAARDVQPIELEVVPVAAPRSYDAAPAGTIGIDELERARAKMIELATALADGPIASFPVTDDPAACTYCSYRNACRERPLPRDDRFGR